MSRIISLTNQKGGVGKTTTSVNLAVSFAVSEVKTLLIDLDPQSNATTGIEKLIVESKGSIYDGIIRGSATKDVITKTKLDYLDIITFAYQDLVDAGQMIGPRAFSTGPGIFSQNNFQSKEEAIGLMKRYRDHYRTRNLKSYIAGNRKQRNYIVQAAHELGMMPTTEGALDLKLDLTHAIDAFHGNEHNFPITPLYKDVVELVAQSGMTYTPTLLVTYGGPWGENYYFANEEVHDDPKVKRFVPDNIIQSKTRRVPWFRKDEYAFSKIAADAAKIIRAGGLVGVGGHGQLNGLGYHWELWSLHSGGMTEMEALRAATINGAKIIGVDADIGSIEVGKLADLVILNKNPLANIRNSNAIEYVMKNGVLYEGNSMNEVWPNTKELEPLWWWNDGIEE